MGPINIQQNINILENEIIFIKNRIKNIENNKKIKEYKEQIFEIEKNTLIANEIEKIKLEIINLQLNLDNIYKIILKENEKEESITKYGIYIKKLENTELNIKSLQIKIEVKDMEIKKLNDKYNNLKIEYGKITELCEEYDSIIQDNNDNELILIIMDKIFIKDMLYNQILVIIENSANKILKYIGIDEIKIEIKNIVHSMEANIIRKIEKTNILRSGKFYYNCYDMVLRLVLNKLNHTIKQDYLIIDELMDGVSEKNKDKMIKMLDYFKDYYEWTLIITHDESIRQYIENSMTIIKENGYSRIL